MDRHPGRGAGRVPVVETLAVAARGASGAGAPDVTRIYYKYEGVSPAGNHKPNTMIAQVHYNKEAGTKRLATETGAGQWGSALAMALEVLRPGLPGLHGEGLGEQKPYRRIFMETFGAEVVPSPSPTTQAGKAVLEADAESTGSLGIAIGEAIEVAATSGGAIEVLARIGPEPRPAAPDRDRARGEGADGDRRRPTGRRDRLRGGGSNYAGLAYPFLADRLSGATPTSGSCDGARRVPTLTKGRFAYDFADTGQMTPLLPMYTLGHVRAAPVHAGGLRYHGDSPSLSLLVKHGHMEASPTAERRVRRRRAVRPDGGSCRRRNRRTRCGERSTKRCRRARRARSA